LLACALELHLVYLADAGECAVEILHFLAVACESCALVGHLLQGLGESLELVEIVCLRVCQLHSHLVVGCQFGCCGCCLCCFGRHNGLCATYYSLCTAGNGLCCAFRSRCCVDISCVCSAATYYNSATAAYASTTDYRIATSNLHAGVVCSLCFCLLAVYLLFVDVRREVSAFLRLVERTVER